MTTQTPTRMSDVVTVVYVVVRKSCRSVAGCIGRGFAEDTGEGGGDAAVFGREDIRRVLLHHRPDVLDGVGVA